MDITSDLERLRAFADARASEHGFAQGVFKKAGLGAENRLSYRAVGNGYDAAAFADELRLAGIDAQIGSSGKGFLNRVVIFTKDFVLPPALRDFLDNPAPDTEDTCERSDPNLTRVSPRLQQG